MGRAAGSWRNTNGQAAGFQAGYKWGGPLVLGGIQIGKPLVPRRDTNGVGRWYQAGYKWVAAGPWRGTSEVLVVT